MNQAALFGFGCVIFFIVLTGAFLYGMLTIREYAETENSNSYIRPVRDESSLIPADRRQTI